MKNLILILVFALFTGVNLDAQENMLDKEKFNSIRTQDASLLMKFLRANSESDLKFMKDSIYEANFPAGKKIESKLDSINAISLLALVDAGYSLYFNYNGIYSRAALEMRSSMIFMKALMNINSCDEKSMSVWSLMTVLIPYSETLKDNISNKKNLSKSKRAKRYKDLNESLNILKSRKIFMEKKDWLGGDANAFNKIDSILLSYYPKNNLTDAHALENDIKSNFNIITFKNMSENDLVVFIKYKKPGKSNKNSYSKRIRIESGRVSEDILISHRTYFYYYAKSESERGGSFYEYKGSNNQMIDGKYYYTVKDRLVNAGLKTITFQ